MVDDMKIRLRSSKLAGGLGLLLALGLITALAVPALAQPTPPPCYYWGTVKICDILADPETVVTARIDGVAKEWTTTVDTLGRYGYNEALGGTGAFYVEADNPETTVKDGAWEGDTVKFYVLDMLAGQREFESLESKEQNLEVCAEYVELTVVASPVEGGIVTGSDTYAYGANAPITATENTDWDFVSWSTGDITEIDDPNLPSTTVYMDKTKTVTANFVEEGVTYYTLTMMKVGQGTVTPEDGSYPEGPMLITATPASGWEFDGWSTTDMGEIADSSAESTTLTLDKDKTVTATFTFEELPGFLSLVEGVNIIAYTGATTPLPGALTNIVDVVDIIWARGAWTDGVPGVVDYWLYYNVESLYGTLTQLEAGRAYIIVVTQDCTWTLP